MKDGLAEIQTELYPIFSSIRMIDQKVAAVRERLVRIEALSPSDIKKIVNMPVSSVNNRAVEDAYFVFCRLSSFDLSVTRPKTLQVLADYAFSNLHRFKNKGTDAELPSAILFFGMSNLLEDYSNWGRYKRWRFNSSGNSVVNKALARISRELLNPNNNGVYKTVLWQRLNKFTPAVIKRCLKIQSNGNSLSTEFLVLAQDFAVHYPNIKIAFDEIKTEVFDVALQAKKKKVFVAQLGTLKGQVNEVEQLQILINRLVGLIGTSRFQGNYEDMLEACLIRLMELSDHKTGLKLDAELLGKCLGIINNYFFTSNIEKFLNTPGRDGYTMGAYIKRTTVFKDDTYPKLKKVITKNNYTKITDIPPEVNETSLLNAVKLGRLPHPQQLLENSLSGGSGVFDEAFVQRLVNIGADLEWMDVRWKDIHGRSPLGFLVSAVGELRFRNSNPKQWNFYLKCKREQNVSLTQVLDKVIDAYVQLKCSSNILFTNYKGFEVAVSELLRDPEVVVTQDMLDKIKLEGDPIRNILQTKAVVNNNNNNSSSDVVVSALNQLRDILDNEYFYFYENLNFLIGELQKLNPAEIEKLSKDHKLKLCMHELTDESKGILMNNGFSQDLIEQGESEGAKRRRECLADLRKRLVENTLDEIPDIESNCFLKLGTGLYDLTTAERVELLVKCPLISKGMRTVLIGTSVLGILCLRLNLDIRQATRIGDLFPILKEALGQKRTLLKDFMETEVCKYLWGVIIQEGDPQTLSFLLGEGGVDVNQETAEPKMSSIDCAVEYGQIDAMRELICRGAKITVALFERAKAKGNKDVISRLEEYTLARLEYILENKEYSKDVNILVQVLGPKIKELQSDKKIGLCQQELSEVTIPLLLDNGFDALLIDENKKLGDAARAENLATLRGILGRFEFPADNVVSRLVMGLGSVVQNLSHAEVKKLLANKERLSQEALDFLAEKRPQAGVVGVMVKHGSRDNVWGPALTDAAVQVINNNNNTM